MPNPTTNMSAKAVTLPEPTPVPTEITPGAGGIVDLKLPEPESNESFLNSITPKLDDVFKRMEQGLDFPDPASLGVVDTPEADETAAPDPTDAQTPTAKATKTAQKSKDEAAKVLDDGTPDPLADIPDDLTEWTPQAAKLYRTVSEELTQTRTRADELEQKVKEYESRVSEMEALSKDEAYQQLTERMAEYDRRMALIRGCHDWLTVFRCDCHVKLTIVVG